MHFLIPIYTAITAGWSGGSLKGHKMFGRLDFMPEVLFSLPFGYALFPFIGWWAVLASVWTYLWFQSGTWPILSWGKGIVNFTRTSTLKPVVDWFADKLKISNTTKAYNILYAAIRGFLITLPVGGHGFVTSPIARELGHRTGNHAITEVLEGFGFGASVLIFWAVFHG